MDTEVQTSPTPKKEVTIGLAFPEAIQAIINGKRVTKLEWGDDEEYCLLQDDYLRIHHANGKCDAWLIRETDMVGEDWVIL